MAQVAGIMGYLASDEATRAKVTYFMSIDNARFRKPVFPGDQLRIEVTTTMNRRGIWGVSGKAYVGDSLVTEADLKATFANAPK
jgi:3-hydroxyacyl-[acyl-carrier-protein] dehydratase